jgi:ribosome modulation factor
MSTSSAYQTGYRAGREHRSKPMELFMNAQEKRAMEEGYRDGQRDRLRDEYLGKKP